MWFFVVCFGFLFFFFFLMTCSIKRLEAWPFWLLLNCVFILASSLCVSGLIRKGHTYLSIYDNWKSIKVISNYGLVTKVTGKTLRKHVNNLVKYFFCKRAVSTVAEVQWPDVLQGAFAFQNREFQYSGMIWLLCLAKWLSPINSKEGQHQSLSISNEKDQKYIWTILSWHDYPQAINLCFNITLVFFCSVVRQDKKQEVAIIRISCKLKLLTISNKKLVACCTREEQRYQEIRFCCQNYCGFLCVVERSFRNA